MGRRRCHKDEKLKVNLLGEVLRNCRHLDGFSHNTNSLPFSQSPHITPSSTEHRPMSSEQ